MPHPPVEKKGLLFEYLTVNYKHYTKTKLKKLLKNGFVTVNGKVTTTYNQPLTPKDKVGILDGRTARQLSLKSELKFPILYEDHSVLVVDKPAGLLTMGTEREKVNTLYYELTEYIKSQTDDESGRIYIVHRLDREASGLLVFAKNESTKRELQENWTQAIKKYYAVVEGTPKDPVGILESYLVEDKFRRVYSIQKKTFESKLAKTRYQVLRTNGRFSLLDITLLTGRKNQIRVQLSDAGHPLVGDIKYGSHCDDAHRLALHAYFLSFTHPKTNDLKTFQTELPRILKNLLREPR